MILVYHGFLEFIADKVVCRCIEGTILSWATLGTVAVNLLLCFADQ